MWGPDASFSPLLRKLSAETRPPHSWPFPAGTSRLQGLLAERLELSDERHPADSKTRGDN